jgi:antitoxin component of RelBE/YafQ-DinJ toxin-antitoxin module
MAEKTTVAFRIDESVKQEWEKAAEGPEYDSLSHLIRLSVQREIAEEQTQRTEVPNDTHGDSEVLQSLTRIERVMTDMQDEVEALGRESRAEELYDLEQVLLEVLPTLSNDIDMVIGMNEPDKLESATAKARDIAGRIGADTSDVSEGLERLDENIGQVRSIKHDNLEEDRYYKVE